MPFGNVNAPPPLPQAGQLLAAGKKKYDAGDRMGALQLWEDCLKNDPDIEQRQAALFNTTCVHAGFGDVELAQITLRDAVQSGLDFKQAAEDPQTIGPDVVRLVASQQVLIRLRKFNESVLKKAGGTAPPPFASSSAGGGGASSSRPIGTGRGGTTGSGGSRGSALFEKDLSKVLDTDMQGIDTSVFGIVRRVVVLLLALSVLGVVLFQVGIKYLFADG